MVNESIISTPTSKNESVMRRLLLIWPATPKKYKNESVKIDEG